MNHSLVLGLFIVFCFLPLMVAILIFKLKSKIKLLHQLIAILLGLLAIVPIVIFQTILPNLSIFFASPILYYLVTSFLMFGLVEESFKMTLLLPLPHKNYTPKAFLYLSFLSGLALGCFENVVYFFGELQNTLNSKAQPLYALILMRIFTSDIIHMSCAGLSGLFIYSCRTEHKKVSPFIWAIVIHGVYDFFAVLDSGLRYFSLVVVLLAIAECRIKYMDVMKSEE